MLFSGILTATIWASRVEISDITDVHLRFAPGGLVVLAIATNPPGVGIIISAGSFAVADIAASWAAFSCRLSCSQASTDVVWRVNGR